eukprot:scaffold193121_cov47-Prasinocladus_malaysianus.AAC.1
MVWASFVNLLMVQMSSLNICVTGRHVGFTFVHQGYESCLPRSHGAGRGERGELGSGGHKRPVGLAPCRLRPVAETYAHALPRSLGR